MTLLNMIGLNLVKTLQSRSYLVLRLTLSVSDLPQAEVLENAFVDIEIYIFKQHYLKKRKSVQ